MRATPAANKASAIRKVSSLKLPVCGMLPRAGGGCTAGGAVVGGAVVGVACGGANKAVVGDAVVGDAVVGDAVVGDAVVGDAVVGDAVVGGGPSSSMIVPVATPSPIGHGFG